MAFYERDEIHEAYEASDKEAKQWREDYPEYRRLMDNGLLEKLDDNMPEVNDGSLAAALFKLAKRVIKKKLGGKAITVDDDDQWKAELATLQWINNILKNAKSMATPRRKWKDAVRKAAGLGGQPIISLFVTRGKYTGSDFIVPPAEDVKLEAGKVSDEDSDIFFWDVYYSRQQWKTMIEQAKAENKEAKTNKSDGYNKWDIAEMEAILASKQEELKLPDSGSGNNPQKTGIHCYIAFQRGVEAPFYMFHTSRKKCVREWSNPDPTGDPGVHYLYCYQDFINPYGVGIVKLAGGTQNVLDYMRKADILATSLGLEPPVDVAGDAESADLDSITYTRRAMWFSGNAKITPVQMGNNVYSELPNRISMYQSSLNKIIPMGDATVSAEAGDPTQSKTPAGVAQAQQSLSIDDEEFSENVDECYAAVAASLINIHFANMQGTDLMRLSADEQEILQRSGIEFPIGEDGQPTQELEIAWDEARGTFDFEVDPDADKTQDEAAALEGKLKAYEMLTADPNIDAYLQQDGKKLNRGELLSDIFSQLTDNDKIITDISSEEMDAMEAEQQGIDPATGQPLQDPALLEADAEAAPMEGEAEEPIDPEREQFRVNIEAIMEEHQVPENVAAAMLDAESQEMSDEEIMELKDALMADEMAGAAV